MTPPCKDCSTRTMGCHITCERYQAFSKQKEEERKDRIKRGILNAYKHQKKK